MNGVPATTPAPTTRSGVRFTLLVLLGVNLLNFFDRQVIGAVAEPVAKALALNDRALGSMTTAFVLLYAVAGVPLGIWADSGRRTHILAASVAVWSVFTALSGLAWGFASLFVFRMGVGVGEAGCAPVANSLLGELFPKERRGRAVSVFMLGLPLGLGLSSYVSGRIADLDPAWGWRAAFFVAGGPGLVVATLALFIPEPPRAAPARPADGGQSFWHGLRVLRLPTMWWIIVSGALHNFNMYALGQFLSPYLQRYHGLSTGDAGKLSAVLYGFGGMGILIGGWACDRAVRYRISGRLELSAVALAVTVPCAVLALGQAPGNPWACLAWFLPCFTLYYMYYSGVYATIQDIIEPSLRGTAMALYFLVMYVVAAQGPLIIGWLSDVRARVAAAAGAGDQARAQGLHDAMYLVPAVGVGLVIVLFLASRTVRRDYERTLERLAAEKTSV